MASEWTIEDLGAAVEAVLQASAPVQENGQVRAVPDRRTIRYYTTLGLLDRPASMRGRTALYGQKHLEQIVAIKRLQSEGLTLAEIQTRLAGSTTRELRAIARVPAVTASAASPAAAPRSRTFWSQAPSREDAAVVLAPAPMRTADCFTGVHIDATLSLLIETQRTLEADDLRALQDAAEPLLRVLRDRGITS